jgi:hypothetical protein
MYGMMVELNGASEMCACYVGATFAPDGCCVLVGLACVSVGVALVALGEWWLH